MQIDYVISWVDGQDSKHKALRKFYLEEDKKNAGGRPPNKEEARFGFEQTTKIRFQDNGEIYYNIASVLRYAPFIRKIFIVTDNQTPALLRSFAEEGKCAADFLQLVSHDEIFARDSRFPQLAPARPSFNSRSIEAALWRIPGLSEHFIFSNDDFFLNAPVTERDFFIDGAPRLFGHWRNAGKMRLRYLCRRLLEKISPYRMPPSHGTSLWQGARLAGGFNRKFLSVPHYPHPLRKSTFADFFAARPRALAKQLSFRFRSPQQFNAVSLANHLEMRQGAAAGSPLDVAYLDDIKSPQHCAPVLEKIKTGAALFGCIQDMGVYPPALQAEIHHILVEKFRAQLPQAVINRLLSGAESPAAKGAAAGSASAPNAPSNKAKS